MKILKHDVSVLDIATHASSANKLLEQTFSVRLVKELKEVKSEKDERTHKHYRGRSEVQAILKRQQTKPSTHTHSYIPNVHAHTDTHTKRNYTQIN